MAFPAVLPRLPDAVLREVDRAVAGLYVPAGRAPEDFASPRGEAALAAPDSVSWRVFKNPASVFVGGVAAVVMELAEPRVRTGVWTYTSFRDRPLERLRGTALATAVTVYGARSRAEALVARVSRLHARVAGTTPGGEPYAASDPELLTWVHMTALLGFLEAYCTWVQPLDGAACDAFCAEGAPAARLYGAAPADSRAALDATVDAMLPRLEASPIVHEFLAIVARMPALPAPLRPVQALLTRAAVAVVPPAIRARLGVAGELAPWQSALVRRLCGAAERTLLPSSPAVQACRRLGLPDAYLYR